jgi:mannose-1-phosphate guanylyltransferase/mannose-1-phosphate guanylyltransferase/phosphomannomutase
VTATAKKSTANLPGKRLEGVLFLAAGFGTRAEPLSHIRPKALLPFGRGTVLGRLARQLSVLSPARVVMNASRCPGPLLEELERAWPASGCRVAFEERPLGAAGTLAGMADVMSGGAWVVVNTDMVIVELDVLTLVGEHFALHADWTVLTGCLPPGGGYQPLKVADGRFGTGRGGDAHFFGVSVMEPCIPLLCREMQLSEGVFSVLAPEASRRGMKLMSRECAGDWLDMGRIDMLRVNILGGGSFVHPRACISKGTQLLGEVHIGAGCILADGTTVRDSVMLEGSSLESGSLEEKILPWFCSSRDGSEQ